MNFSTTIIVLLLCVGIMSGVGSRTTQADHVQPHGRGHHLPYDTPLPPSLAANAEFSVILGRPTDTSVVASLLSATAVAAYIDYGLDQSHLTAKTQPVSLQAGRVTEIAITGLKTDTAYAYSVRIKHSGDVSFSSCAAHSFHTQRTPGSEFTFDIQGDSHPERPQQHDISLYAQTLAAAAADHPDFYLTIGDDFSVDTLTDVNGDNVRKLYVHQRQCLAAVAQDAPLFLTNGNHEQAEQCYLDGTANNIAVWAGVARNDLFPQPMSDGFYTGDPQTVDHIGLLRDYYAWTWGDALFVVIDPYWHSPKVVDNPFGGGEKTHDLWNSTLGEPQYKWLKATLETSKAKYKFIFTHHILGTGRGGVEESTLCEWGGVDKRGDNQFAARRSGWEMPIHQLMVKTGVTILFQGHDHIWVHQQRDGVVYQELSEPADPNYALYNDDAYRSGDKFPNSGYTRVSVAPDKVTVSYVRQYLPKDESATRKSGDVAFSYSVSPIKR